MLYEKPYKKNMIEDLAAKGYPWIDSFKAVINKHITEVQAALEAEAAYDGQPELLDEEFLYERFVDNVEHDFRKANWQILKYFIWKFKIKVMKDIIGEWTFTDHDVEMYCYFSGIPVDMTTKCMPRLLNLHCEGRFTCDDAGYKNSPVSMWQSGFQNFGNEKFNYGFVIKDKNNHYNMVPVEMALAIADPLIQIENMVSRATFKYKVSYIMSKETLESHFKYAIHNLRHYGVHYDDAEVLPYEAAKHIIKQSDEASERYRSQYV